LNVKNSLNLFNVKDHHTIHDIQYNMIYSNEALIKIIACNVRMQTNLVYVLFIVMHSMAILLRII